MNKPIRSQPIRENEAGWTIVDAGDNGVEILEHRISVNNFSQATDIANRLSPLVMAYEPLDSEYTIRVNLTRWVVEVRLSAPKGLWESEAQEQLAKGVVALSEE
jgi:hypothetical protein